MRSSLDESARPDRLPSAQRATTRTTEYLLPQSPPSRFDDYRVSNVSNDQSRISGKTQTIEEVAEEQIPPPLPDDELVIEHKRDRAVKYVLPMISSLNAILTVSQTTAWRYTRFRKFIPSCYR
jgi:hypothetical protein